MTRSICCSSFLVLGLSLFLATPSLEAADRSGPTVIAGTSVQFSDRSTDSPTNWSWDFDYDGDTPNIASTEQHPITSFTEGGVYLVYLEACNVTGCDESVQAVTVTLPDDIFDDNFESGGLMMWTSVFPTP